MHKALGLFHRLCTPSRWPAVSPDTFVRVSVPPSISSSFKLNSACYLLEDKNTVPPSVTAIPMRPGIFEIVLSFNRPLSDKDEYMNHSRLQLTGIACHMLMLMKIINYIDQNKTIY